MTLRDRALASLLTLTCAATASSLAHGEEGGAPETADAAERADRLFERAAALMAEGRWQEACPKFQESYELDPARGALLGLAQCHEHRGEVASAYRSYEVLLEDARAAGDDRRAAIARDRLSALEPRLPTLAIRIDEGASIDGLTVRLGGDALAADALGEPLPVDPGVHEIAAEAPGREPWTIRVELAEGESEDIVVPALARETEEAPPSPGDAIAEREASASPQPPPLRYARGGNLAQRWVGYSAMSGGALSTATGVAFAIRAIRKHQTYQDLCPDSDCEADDDIARIVHHRDAASTLATALIGVGLVAVTGGIVLWTTAPREDWPAADRRRLRVEPLVEPSSLGASLRATF